jgi:hypothetical protein
MPTGLCGWAHVHVHPAPRIPVLSPSNQPVTAETFRFSIERVLSPKLAQYSYGLTPAGPQFIDDIEGERAFREGTADRISGLRTSGTQVVITLTEPSPDFLERLALPFFCPVPTGTPYSLRSRSPASGTGQSERRLHCLVGAVLRGGLCQRAMGDLEAQSELPRAPSSRLRRHRHQGGRNRQRGIGPLGEPRVGRNREHVRPGAGSRRSCRCSLGAEQHRRGWRRLAVLPQAGREHATSPSTRARESSPILGCGGRPPWHSTGPLWPRRGGCCPPISFCPPRCRDTGQEPVLAFGLRGGGQGPVEPACPWRGDAHTVAPQPMQGCNERSPADLAATGIEVRIKEVDNVRAEIESRARFGT